MGCGSTKSKSLAEIVQLRPFPIDSKSKLPNEALEGFGSILQQQGSLIYQSHDKRKKPGKLEPGTNVYSKVIKDSNALSQKKLNIAEGKNYLDSNQEYSHKLQELPDVPQPKVDVGIPTSTEKQNTTHIFEAAKAESEHGSFVQSRKRSLVVLNEDKLNEHTGSRVLVFDEESKEYQDPEVINYVDYVQVVKLTGETDVANKELKEESHTIIDGNISPANSESDQSVVEIDPQEEINRLEELRKQHEREAQAQAARKNAELRRAELEALSGLTGEVDRANEILSKYK